MAGERERPGGTEGRSDDLFEDLDRFFSSIDESEWPDAEGTDEEPAAAEGSSMSQDTPASRPASMPELDHDERTEEPSPRYGDTDVEARGEGATGVGADAESPAPEPVGTGAGRASELESPDVGSTREMTGEDWARLRDVLGEEEEGEDFRFTEVPTELGPDELSPEESLFGYAPGKGEAAAPEEEPEPWVGTAVGAETPTDEEEPEPWVGTAVGAEMPTDEEPLEPAPGELSLEDLKKAPREYDELPREDDFDLPPVDLGEDLPGAADEPSKDTETFEISEPSLADVEAAADHLAGEFMTPGGVDDDLLELQAPPEPARRTVKVGEPESLQGPAWEDPTAQTVTREAAASPDHAARNLTIAMITGVRLAVVALITVFVAKWLFALLAGAVILFGQLELYTTMKRRDYQPATALGLVLGGFVLAAAYLKGEPAMQFILAIGVLLSCLWYMAAVPKARSRIVGNVGATLLGLAYVPFLAWYIFAILTSGDSGRSLMLAVLGLTFANDIAAFAFGSIWGSRPLAPSISPRKSLEGLLGGTFVTILLAIAFVPSIDGMTVVRSVGLALVVCVFAPLGDLTESLLKRDLGVKDMGNILPGHGGVLDRIDSALFVVPAAFYFLRLIF
ncbi:MAG: phosphatidate cytidylyltransferase [Actinomycetota bacterium]